MRTKAYDLLLRGGSVVDGSGADAYLADVAVLGDQIVAIGLNVERDALLEVDVAGKVIAPGFIDVHTHDDNAVLRADMSPKTSQGVTTVVTGNCGISLAPLRSGALLPPPLDLLGDASGFFESFADFVDEFDARPAAVNVAALIGHMTLRVDAMVPSDRAATDEELAFMKQRLRAALQSGAIGLSTGLWYEPSQGATPEEVEALVRCAAEVGGIYTTHMRNEADKIFQSLDESFTTARRAGARLVISHHKVAGKPFHGLSGQTLAAISEAMRQQEISLDAYPYSASSTVIRPYMAEYAEKTLITWSVPFPELAGRYLHDIAGEWEVSDIEAAERLKPGGAVYWILAEADVQRILAYEHTMIGSDGLPHDLHPHPRLWGTFPRVLGHYARDLGLFTMEEAVRKMTSLPARHFNLAGRGLVREGYFADLVVFDPKTVIDRATYEHPTRASAGIEHVFVNGARVWSAGAATTERPGRLLRRPAIR